MPDYRFDILDVFTDRPFAGNQLAVFRAAEGIPEELLQPLARELNFSETVFAYPGPDRDSVRIRIFTPTAELPFAGHPVLGSAVALSAPDQTDIELVTKRAPVPVRLERRDGRSFGEMTQPIPAVTPFGDVDRLLAALHVPGSQLPVELYDNGPHFVYVALESPEAVATLRPDLAAIGRDLPDVGIYCFAGSGSRWKARMFFPADGIAEDPATGSAAGPLGVHLARHGRIAFGEQIEVSQGAEVGRPSTLYVRVQGSTERIEQVRVGGYAVLVGRGEFDLPA